jgi:F420-dependent oxidoreductase-like protein
MRLRRWVVDLCLMIEGQEGVTWPQWVALAQACEEHGVPAMFRSDHYLNLDGMHPERGSLDAWATIAALAAVTRVRLGTLVSPATFRHPSTLAKMVATADQISGGRIELGIGAGWHEREHSAYGFDFPPTRVRMDILEEQLEVIYRTWADEPSSFAGEHYRTADLDARPKPVQRPRPPVIIGGSGGARSIAIAARYGDEYNTPFPTLDDIRPRRDRLQEACAQAGRDPIPFSVMTSVIVGRDRGELRDRMLRLGKRIDQDGESLLREPPAGWIVGTVEEAAQQLSELAGAGVSRIMCQQLLHDDLEAVSLLGGELAKVS